MHRKFITLIVSAAIAVTGLVPGEGIDARSEWLRDRMSAFAGRALEFDDAVFVQTPVAGLFHAQRRADRARRSASR